MFPVLCSLCAVPSDPLILENLSNTVTLTTCSSKKRAAAEEEAPAGADDSTASLSKNQKKKLAKKQKSENGEAVAPAAAAVPEPKKKAEEPKKADTKKVRRHHSPSYPKVKARSDAPLRFCRLRSSLVVSRSPTSRSVRVPLPRTAPRSACATSESSRTAR